MYEALYAMQDSAMLMLQLEVNISSSQGFSLVNQPSTPNFSPKNARPVDDIFIECLPVFHMFSGFSSFYDLN